MDLGGIATCPDDGQYAHRLAIESMRGMLRSGKRYRLELGRRGGSFFICPVRIRDSKCYDPRAG